MYLVDTNILAYFIKQNPQICKKFLEKEEEISLCSIVQAECYFGAKKQKNIDLLDIYETMFELYPVLSFDSKSSVIFCDLKVELSDKGQIIEDFDLMIASICLANNLTLVTNNTKHFENIRDLKIENWVK